MNPEPGKFSNVRQVADNNTNDVLFFEKLSILSGIIIAAIGFLEIIGLYMGISPYNIIMSGSGPGAISTALIWVFFGIVIVSYRLGKIRGYRAILVQAALLIIAVGEAVEIPLSMRGTQVIVGTFSFYGVSVLPGTLLSPVAPLLIIPAALGLILIVRTAAVSDRGSGSDTIGGLGVVIGFVSFAFILGYLYGTPILYGTQYIPITLGAATAAFFVGISFVTIAGPGAFPLVYFVGDSTKARLLRAFVPLTVIIILAENLLFVALTTFYPVQGAIRVAASLVLFIIITSYAVGRVSSGLGWALDQAESLLVRRNEDLNLLNKELNASNRELLAAEDELRHTVTVLTKMENELRESGQRLKRAQEIAHLGSWDLDLVKNRLTWSDEVYRIFGLDPQEFGRTFDAFLEAVHPEDRAFVAKTYMGSIEEGKGGVEIEHRIIRPGSGEIRYVHEKCEHIRDDTGRTVLSIGMVHDITERKRAEEALRQANAKINMLSSITRHDILNKITALRSYLELSKYNISDQEMLNYIAKEDSIAQVIAEQIEFTRFYEEMGVHTPSWQDIPGIIRMSVAQLNLTGITVDIAIPGLEVYADPLIGKVFYNLMDNSIRHGIHVSRIRITFNENHNGGTIVYADDGIGVASEYKKKIFAKGFGNNTGLGLFLSREILSITGITIEETGMPGKGVQFEIGIPNEYYRTAPDET